MHPSNRRADGARNRRKNRHGTFWEDGYPSRLSLHQCVVYIDLNMVRAEWSSIRAHGNTAGIARFTSRLAAIYPIRLLPIAGLYRITSGVSKFDLQGLMH